MNKNVININNDEFKYCSFGKGKENLIIIPGIYLRSIVDKGDEIEKAFSYLADKYTVYLFDRKTILNDGDSIENMADDLIEVIKKLNIDSCDVYAASQGAIIAEYIAIKTNLINKMILASSVSKIDEYTENVFKDILETIKFNNIKSTINKFLDDVYSPEMLDKYRDSLVSEYSKMNENDIHNLKVMCEAMNTSVDNRFKLKEKKIKTLVVGSKQDRIFKTSAIEELIEDLSADGYFYDGYSHGVYDEAESFHDLMKSFLLDN